MSRRRRSFAGPAAASCPGRGPPTARRSPRPRPAPQDAPAPPIAISEQDGLRYLHFGTEWVQGAMSMRRPWDIAIDYVQQMMAWLLFLAPPPRILQLGLGAGALTRWCWRHLPQGGIDVVESARNVIVAARSHFRLPPDDERLCVHHAEAGQFVARAAAVRAARWAVIQADLYDARARGPVCDSLAFYRACRAALDPAAGILVVNLFGEHASYARNLKRIGEAFEGRVLTLPPVAAGNVVVLALSGPPLAVSAQALLDRAAFVERHWRLPSMGWARALLDNAGSHSSEGPGGGAQRLVV